MNSKNKELLADYRTWLLMKNFKPRGIEEKLRHAVYFFTYLEENSMETCETGYKQACAYREYLATRQNKNGMPRFTASSVNVQLANLRQLFYFLLAKGLAMSNPFLEAERMKESEHLPKNVLSIDETGRLLSGITVSTHEDLKFKTAVELLYSTGMRIAELENLRREDIDLERGTILVRDDKERQDRLCALTGYAHHLLALYLGSLTGENPFVHGRPRTLNRFINDRLKRLCVKLELPVITCHGIRHTIATHLLAKGADLREVQEFLGHKRIKNTEIYTRLTHEDLKKVVDSLHPRERAHA